MIKEILHINKFLCLLACSILGASLFCVAKDLPISNHSKIKSFQTMGTDEAGNRLWLLQGSEAVIIGNDYCIKDLSLIYYKDGDEIHLRSPLCYFDEAKGVGKSKSKITVTTADLTMSGVGYDFMVSKQRLHIRSKAHIIIKDTKAISTNIIPSKKVVYNN